ncbi:hypothetical protein TeGR_g7900 [Tetraparma gracilis]|uniref:Bestrophin homolog n=1 Tax=Tetraparma gracilis TaxID=2962635 RepID=A0ABQ6MWL8_9STRA|nr:hypothetical protein TeGR_g7900 [Tetraparma gracilis]
MTVPYSAALPSKFSSVSWFRTVVFRWRGSVYKLIAVELCIIVCLWYLVDFFIGVQHQATRDELRNGILFMRTYQNSTRTLLSFMLVYYYQQIWGRARGIFFAIPWPDNPFFMTGSLVGGNDEEGRMQRRTVFRYVLATNFLIFVGISEKFKRAYGSNPFASLVKLGLLTAEEVRELETRFVRFPYLNELSFIPLVWAQDVVRRSFEGRGDGGERISVRVIEAIREFRVNCAAVLFEVYLPFPLLLSQLVTVLTYCQLLVTVVAQQNSYKDGESVFFFPIFTCLEALVYIGALRVGQIYTNPLGADDDDYEVVSFFNRNLKLAGLYGCYGLGGGGGGEEEGAGGDEDFDFRSNAPPMTDLRAAQETVLRRVPVEVYAHEHSRTGVDDDFAEGVPPREGAEIPSTPQLRLSVAARKKMKESEEPLLAPV